MIDLHESLKNFKALRNGLPSGFDWNEAQTRFHIIDRILRLCLAWTDEITEVETYESNGYTDYELGKPRIAILEAKREGVHFEIPPGGNKKKISLHSLMANSAETKAAINQVQSYCSIRGVPIAIICNGHQLIGFLASRQDGISVFDGSAVVFDGLADIENNFPLFWKLFSSFGIKEHHIYHFLSDSTSGIPNKLSSKLVNYPSARYPSELQSNLRQLSDIFLNDILDNSEIEKKFFDECYCESGALSQYAMLSKNILDARYASLFPETEPVPYLTPVKQKKSDNFSPEILAESISKRPIVLLGDVGVGKTSFIKNLMHNSAHEQFRNAVYIYIDLGSKASLISDLRSFILSEIERQLFEKYQIDINARGFVKSAYMGEINRFSAGIWGGKKDSDPELYETKLFEELQRHMDQRDQHLKRCINSYSKSSKRQVIISIDNADQRDYDIQQSSFLISQELAKDWNSTVFVSVRPQTFFNSKRSGALAAYPHKIFTISPPRLDSVINKRLIFALSMADGRISIETLDYLKVNSESLVCFLKALIGSLSENSALEEFLINITGGNIRAAIEFVTGFIGSPNVDAEKIIKIMSSSGKYNIPLHEFTKSALLGEYSHYSSDRSLAMNVFDVSSPSTSEHFLVLMILSFLEKSGAHKNNDGFCKAIDIFNEFQQYGFNVQQISGALRRCTNKKLIETSQRVTFEEDVNGSLIGEMPDYFRVTTIGVYHLKRWVCDFTYIDAMVFDTPIFDQEIRSDILKSINSLSISDRYQRSLLFKNYLIKCWSSIGSHPEYLNFTDAMSEGGASFQSVNRAIEKNGFSN